MSYNWVDERLAVGDIHVGRFTVRQQMQKENVDHVMDIRLYFTQEREKDLEGEMPTEKLISAIYRVCQLMADDNRVIVHCYGGIDRSPFFAAATIAIYNNVDIDIAYERVQTRRPQTIYHPEWIKWFRENYHA